MWWLGFGHRHLMGRTGLTLGRGIGSCTNEVAQECSLKPYTTLLMEEKQQNNLKLCSYRKDGNYRLLRLCAAGSLLVLISFYLSELL